MRALKLFILFSLITGVIYPLAITLMANLVMPKKALGSLIYNDANEVIGSSLIGQKFENEGYFWPRPSETNYNPLPSFGSNLGPTSALLKKNVEEQKAKFGSEAPSDLLFSSASGVDPHITLKGAFYQMDRVAKARNLNRDDLEKLILNQVEGKYFGFLGEPCVNVLLLNLKLDKKL